MDTKNFFKKLKVSTLAAAMAFTIMPYQTFTVLANDNDQVVYADNGMNTIGTIASKEDIKVDQNVVNIQTEKSEGIKVTFLSDTMFRFNLEPKGEFVDEPDTNNSQYTAKMLVKPISEYQGVVPVISEDAQSYIIKTDKVALYIDKADSKMKMVNLETNVVEWSEKEPLQYGNNQTTQTLNTSDDEYYYGGGMQNGYFSHKNKKIHIYDKADAGNWGDGMISSPTPFYMSTTGYGVMRFTWANGQYDFDTNHENAVKTTHNENRFDAIYFSGSSLKDALNQYTQVTGKPVLLPEYAYYLGHANCYNRDYWVKDNNGKYEFNGERWTEKGATNPGGDALIETLNGENGGISARTVLDKYQSDDMPLGWFLPNDGYGCGYGQDDSDSTPDTADAEAIDINVANLNKFSEYANAKGVQVGLWTQSDLVPRLYDVEGKLIPPHLRRDVVKEVDNGGVRAIKTDVAWVGEGGAMALNSVQTAATTIENYSDYRPFLVSLFGWNGTQRFASIWSGDQTGGDWEYIRFHIPSYIGLGLSGNPNVGSDMDGIYDNANPVVQTRDYQWKSFTPVEIDMDGWGSTIKNPSANKEYAAINRMYLKMKSEMLPYYYSAAYEATNTGTPTVRAMVLEYPNDMYARSTATQYQYMWGENLLVAPIYQNTDADEKGNDIRNNIYLPDENQVWIDYFTGKQYTGGNVLNNYDAPVWKLPLFVKNGAIIPMTEENNSPDDIAKDASRIFDVYPSGNTSYKLFEDDGHSNGYQGGNYATTKITSSAPVTGEGKAVITVNKAVTGDSDIDYMDATGNAKKRATEFKVHVQQQPKNVTLQVGGKDTALTSVKTKAEFDKSNGNVYYYDKQPLLKTYAKDGESISEDDSALTSTPILYVKAAKTDITENAVAVTIDGFNNTQQAGSDGMTSAPATPENFAINEDNITDNSVKLTWTAVTGNKNAASYYEIRVNGESNKSFVLSNITTASYVHEDLTQNTDYIYELRAVNSAGKSAWTAPIKVKTKLDPYRNVPEGIEASVNYPSGWDVGNLVNRNTSDMWFSNWDDASALEATKVITLDMGANYTMDKVELYGIPNKPAYISHRAYDVTVDKSIDGKHWKTLYEHADLEWVNNLATLNLDNNSMRYIRITANTPKSTYLAMAEIIPYKVDGTRGSATGDVNGDGEASANDLTFMQNYVGIHDSSTTWVQVNHADINYNGMIDGYDLAFINAWSTIHYSATNKKLTGDIVALPSKNVINKGEVFTVDLYANNFNDVDGFSFELNDSKGKYEIVGNIAPGPMASNMLFYPGNDKARVMAAAVNTNEGGGSPLNGNGKLASVTLKAKTDTVFDMNVVNAFIANTQYDVKAAEPIFMAADAAFPDVDSAVKILTNGSDFTLTSTTPDKFQSSADLGNAADGDRSTVSELKWGAAAEMPLNYTFDLTAEKEIKKVDVVKRTTSNGVLKTMQMIGYLNGEEVYNETLDSPKEAEILTFSLPAGTKLDKIEMNALDSHQESESTKYLTIKEIEIYGRNNSDPTGIVMDSANPTQMKFNTSAIFKANVLPASAINPYYTITSSDPSLISVKRIQDAEDGTIAYYLSAGTTADGKSKDVIITATSADGKQTITQTVNVIGENIKLPHAGMIAKASSEETNGGETPGTADAVLDDNYATYWHSVWTTTHTLPQWIQIELPETAIVNMIDFTPRQNARNGYITKYEVQVSETGAEDDFTKVAEGTLPHNDLTKYIDFAPVKAKFVRLVALEANTTGNDTQVAAVSEMNVYKVMPNFVATSDKTNLLPNETAQITMKVLPDDMYGDLLDGKTLTYKSSDEAVLSVDQTGKVTATDQGGQATISISAEDLGALAFVTFNVKADTSALEAAIQALSDLNKDDYTPNSWSAFQLVVENAKALLQAPDVSKTQINDMIEALNHAKNNILLPPLNTEDLAKAIEDAKKVIEGDKENDYTAASSAKLSGMIRKGERIAADENATAEEAAQAIKDIKNAYDNLVNIILLKQAVAAGIAIDPTQYVDESIAKFNVVLESSKAVLANAYATQIEVNKAYEVLTTAIDGLVKVGDNKALLEAIKTAKKYDAKLYTEASYAVLQKAIAAAQDIADGKYAQTVYDQAVKDLQQAISKLERKPSKTELANLIAKAKKYDKNLYTSESYAVLKKALAAAEKVNGNKNATQAEIDKAVLNLNNAIKSLQKVNGNTNKPGDGDNNKPGGGTSTKPGGSITGGGLINKPGTGDSTNAGMLAGTITFAGIALAVMLYRKRKEEQ